MNIADDVRAMVDALQRDQLYGPYRLLTTIEVPLHTVTRTTILEDGLEFWDFGSDDFLLEAWDVMTFGGVHVRA